jgi:hypothetical protein
MGRVAVAVAIIAVRPGRVAVAVVAPIAGWRDAVAATVGVASGHGVFVGALVVQAASRTISARLR